MIQAIDISEVHDYTLKSDTVEPTIFRLGVLDSFTRARLLDAQVSFDKEGETRVNIRTLQIEAVKNGLKGWSNFKMKGAEQVFKTVKDARGIEVVADESLKMLSSNVIAELANQILLDNTLSEQDLKN